jgi:SNF2 family DNA or RNA helicase
MTDRIIGVELLNDGTTVRLERGASVPDEVWLQVRSEWGSSGSDVARRLVVPLERFLARRGAFAKLCKRNGIVITLDEEVKALALRARADRADLRSAIEELTPLDVDALAGRLKGGRFKRDLRDFQARDLGHLLALSHGANFSVPGAGKTAVAYAAYEAERLAGRIERMLVIGPLSAFPAWFEEADESFNDPPSIHRFEGGSIPRDAEIVLTNYHRLTNNYDTLAAWVTEEPTMVILDEAHRMKRGWGGQWGSACLNLAYLAYRRDILTGTPAPQSPKDFVALLDFLWPTEATRILPPDTLVMQPPPDAGERVARAIGPLFVRTTKDELGLPAVSHHPVVVPLEGLHRSIYLALRDQYAGQFAPAGPRRRDFLAMGRIVMYLLEAATNPKLLTAGSLEGSDPDVFRHPPLEIPAGSDLAELLAKYNEYEMPTKFRELGRLIRENAEQGRKTLVWSNFVRNLKLLERMLAAYQPALIHGAVPAYSEDEGPTRETEVLRFRHDPECRVLLANPAAISEGISLHRECHDAIYLERTFNAGQYLQSVDRIHRLGLPAGIETRITFLMTDETIDMTVDSRVRDKAERLGEMLEDPALATVALPNEEDYGPPVDSDLDVQALFEHLRGDDGP